jgi:NADP-dependent 3-hydroxy acid dehydrogenase YdfG
MRASVENEPRTTLIAGVSPAILEVTDTLTEQGERVVLFFRTREKMQELATHASVKRKSVLPLAASVTDGKSVIQAYEKLVEWSPRLDCLIYNVGLEPGGETQTFSGAELVRVMGLNFYGFVNCFSLALPLFKHLGQGHAVIIYGAAALALEGQPAAYAASRAALQIYLRALRQELASQAISITELYMGRKETVRGPRRLSQREIVEGILQVLRGRPEKHIMGIP